MNGSPYALLLTDDRPARANEFRKAALDFLAFYGLGLDRLHECDSVGDITAPTMPPPEPTLADESVSHLAVFGHGTPNGFFRPGRWGVDARPRRHDRPRYISPQVFARAWAPKLTNDALISLACCLCSRAPKWRRIQLFGRDISAWAPQAYRDGGLKSVAAVLTRAFALYNKHGVAVRGHCAAGHTTYQALLREHRAHDEQGLGRSLFGMVFPGVEPTWPAMRRWQRIVKGDLARAYLLNLRTETQIINEIRDHFSA